MKKAFAIVLICSIVLSLLPMMSLPVAANGQFTGNRDWKWPVPNYPNITSCFMNMDFYIHANQGGHYALDIWAPTGTAIYASYPGHVLYAGWSDSLGWCVYIQHSYLGTSFVSRYGHMSQLNISGNPDVTKSTVIGYVGATGNVTGEHLDFMIYHGDNCSVTSWGSKSETVVDPFMDQFLEMPVNFYAASSSTCCKRYVDEAISLYSSPLYYKPTLLNMQSVYSSESIISFSWAPISGVSGYELIVTDVDGNTVCAEYGIPNTTTSFSCQLPCGTYRVAAVSVWPSGGYDYSDWVEFSVAKNPYAPIVSISNSGTSTYPSAFSWAPIPGVSNYELIITDLNGETVYAEYNIPSTTTTFSHQLQCGTYRVAVVSVWPSGGYDYSDWVEFSVVKNPYAPIVSIADTGTSSAPTVFLWTPISGVSNYELIITDVNGETVYAEYNIPSTTTTFSHQLQCGTYQVAVVSVWPSGGYDYSEQVEFVVIEGHDYVAVITEPTCAEPGYTTYTCSICGDSYKDNYMPALGHNYIYKVTTTPTISATGTLTGTCSRCSGISTVTLPKLNTTDYIYSVTKAAVCTATGTGRYTWKTTTYGTFYFDVTIAKTAHTYTATVTTPTCTEKGYTTHTCTVCGDSYKDTYTDTYTDALGHSWDDGVITTKPTETTEGVKTFTCSRCGTTKTESVPALDHTHSYTATVTPPTCTEKGYTTYTCACGDSYVTDYVGALSHNFVGGICTRCGEDDPNYNPPTPKDPCEGYTDIDRSSWYHTAADFVIERGLMGSTKTDALTFEPNTKVSRAMVASILYTMAGKPAATYQGTFTDVPSGKWFTTAIEWCAQNGLASGKGNGKFDPNGNVTRQELAVFMMQMAAYLGKDTSGRADLGGFADASKVPSWAKTYARWAVDAGLISGKASGGKTYLAPTDNATRAELAVIIRNFVQNIAEAD